MPTDQPLNFAILAVQATRRDLPLKVEAPGRRKRTLEIGNTLKRKRKGDPSGRYYPWAIVRDVITAPPAQDTTEYVAVLCEGIEELAAQWFVWRTYFTKNRHGQLHFGQYGPQAPFEIDKWISEQIVARRWVERILG